MAELSNARLQDLGQKRLLPIGWGVWFQRPIAGCFIAAVCQTRYSTPANITERIEAVRGRRCTALVAPAFGKRCSYHLLRRLFVAALCSGKIHGAYRRCRDTGRTGRLSRRPVVE